MTDIEKIKLIKKIIDTYWECGEQTGEASGAILIAVHAVAGIGGGRKRMWGGNAP